MDIWNKLNFMVLIPKRKFSGNYCSNSGLEWSWNFLFVWLVVQSGDHQIAEWWYNHMTMKLKWWQNCYHFNTHCRPFPIHATLRPLPAVECLFVLFLWLVSWKVINFFLHQRRQLKRKKNCYLLLLQSKLRSGKK